MPYKTRIFGGLRYTFVDELEDKKDANLVAGLLGSTKVKTKVIPTSRGYSVYSCRKDKTGKFPSAR